MMDRLLILLLAICTLSAAMVPRHRRAFNEEEYKRPAKETKEREFCAPQTPCAWSIYNPATKDIELNVTNTYCLCAPGQVCHDKEDDVNAFALVFRCKHADTLETPES